MGRSPRKKEEKETINLEKNFEINNKQEVEVNDVKAAEEESKDNKVKCMFLINVKYGDEIKAIGEFLDIDKEEAVNLEKNAIVKVVK